VLLCFGGGFKSGEVDGESEEDEGVFSISHK